MRRGPCSGWCWNRCKQSGNVVAAKNTLPSVAGINQEVDAPCSHPSPQRGVRYPSIDQNLPKGHELGLCIGDQRGDSPFSANQKHGECITPCGIAGKILDVSSVRTLQNYGAAWG